MRIRPPEIETSICDVKYHREHCDVLSMQMDSDLVIYRTTLVRTFQVVTIYRVDKSEVLVVLISPHYSKRSYSDQQMKIQQMRRGARYGMSCDDISVDVITISRCSKAQKLKRRRVKNQQMKQSTRTESYCSSAGSYSATSRRYLKIAIAKRCRLHELIRQRFAVALKIQQEDFALMFNQQARRISSYEVVDPSEVEEGEM
ncbi:hypothetical protein F511_16938 [Dorcoceras hygrometricum]|uniref:Uncharacterized protein n=1 Tax=Dorcoceras hygrometricum TaxID=472368 RepID=A0A2Z7CBF3_9LAMI|nr:hypothetical protein F511_16938 [Dorcoceras hygrometricum]